jgi:hypothetical protein
MEKCVLGVTDVDEGCFQTGIQILDATLVDAADHPVIGLTLDFEFLQPTVHEQRDTFFQRLRIDNQLSVRTFFLLEHRQNFLKKGTILGPVGSAGFQLRRGDRRGVAGWRRIDEFFVIFLGKILGNPRSGLRLIAHVG